MHCKEIENIIWDYAEGKLPEAQQNAVKKHLESCTSCAALAQGISSSLDVIEKSKKTEANPYFYSHLEARLQNETEKAGGKIAYSLRFALAASIAIIGIVGGSLLGSYSAEQLNSMKSTSQTSTLNDELGFDFADNSFDLINDFEK